MESADAGGGGLIGLVVTPLGTHLSTQVLVAFIDSVKERFGVEPVCRVLSQFVCKIAPSTYYAARSRPPSAREQRDEKIGVVLEEIWRDPDGGREVAGARKMWQLMRKRGITVDGGPVARCTIERLMRSLGLVGARRGESFYRTTRSDPSHERAPDLVGRNFTAAAPNRLWVVDFTYLDTTAGRAFAAFVLDVFSRRIVGWAVADHHLTELPLAALEMALYTRGAAGQDVKDLVHHSDAGSEYTAIRYRNVLTDFEAVASIGTVGDSYDNVMAESLNGLYKTECIWRQESWVDVREIEYATSSWVAWYNSRRLHSSLGYRSPIEYENAYCNGELPEPGDQPADQTDTGTTGPDEQRDNDRDINPRTYEHAG
ncbi:MAG: IS3 family transposase [Actinobacteria bacterium]|nr:IS3 family transposase [Actinomycetota bacterium]